MSQIWGISIVSDKSISGVALNFVSDGGPFFYFSKPRREKRTLHNIPSREGGQARAIRCESEDEALRAGRKRSHGPREGLSNK